MPPAQDDRFFELSLDMLCTVDFEGRFRRVNQAWTKALGYSTDELVGQPFISFVHPDDQEMTIAASARVTEGQDVLNFENRYRASDGSYHWLEWRSAVILEEQVIYAATRDITTRRNAEMLLRDSEQRLTQFLDALPVGVFVVDAQGQPFYANQTAQAILGQGIMPGTTVGKLAEVYSAYIAGTDQIYPTEQLPIVRALQGERVTINNMEVHHPQRRIRLEVMGTPIRDVQGAITYAMIAFSDITERQMAQEALQQRAAQEELIEAQAQALRELSTPMLAINDSTVVIPLIGTIDSRRAQQVMETLLEGVASYQAATAIVDITGVSVVDTQVANALIHAAQAVQLLGAQVVITGIRPEVAQILVSLGVDLSGIVTRATLQSGIAFALQ